MERWNIPTSRPSEKFIMIATNCLHVKGGHGGLKKYLFTSNSFGVSYWHIIPTLEKLWNHPLFAIILAGNHGNDPKWPPKQQISNFNNLKSIHPRSFLFFVLCNWTKSPQNYVISLKKIDFLFNFAKKVWFFRVSRA